MLLKDFFNYTLVEQSDQKICAEIILNRRHTIFAGHFENNPIVPGVCQVQMITDILNDIFNVRYHLLEAKNIKFLSMIIPEEAQTLKLELKISKLQKKRLKVNGILSNHGKVCMKIGGIFGER